MSREAWQRGPVADVLPALQPAAHAVLHAREDLDAATPGIAEEHVWASPGDVASIGWHLLHLAGSTQRLLTYARGEALSEAQWAWLEREKTPRADVPLATLVGDVHAALDNALALIRDTRAEQLDEPCHLGRARIEVTLRGLLFHTGEHATRHVGQVITTAKLLRTLSRG